MQSLRRVFQNGFIVSDLAEPLVSFDSWSSASRVRICMEEQGLEVAGVRREGRIQGYLSIDRLGDGDCNEYIQPFEPDQLIDEAASLADLIAQLKEHSRLFVLILGSVGGVVSRTDIQKPPVRMWLFGMLTLIEMRLTKLIDQHFLNEAWTEFLSDSRVEKAQQLLDERRRRNQERLVLLDCLQLSDKTQIIARHRPLLERTRFTSRRQLEDVAKRLEKLRNNLAHIQDIVSNDWETIVGLSEGMDAVLEGPPGLKESELNRTNTAKERPDE